MTRAELRAALKVNEGASTWEILSLMADCFYAHGKGNEPLDPGEILQLAAMLDALSKKARAQANCHAALRNRLMEAQENLSAALNMGRPGTGAKQTVEQIRASLAAENVVLFPVVARPQPRA